MKTLVSALAVLGAMALTAGQAAAMSPADCQASATVYANNNTVGGGVVGGAVGGGVLGGVIAGISGGDVGAGVAAGAVGGGVVGGLTYQQRWQQNFNQYYYQCVNAAPQPAPVQQCPALVPPTGYDNGYLVGSQQWIWACDQKYKSFNPQTWLFNGYDGCKHYCNLP